MVAARPAPAGLPNRTGCGSASFLPQLSSRILHQLSFRVSRFWFRAERANQAPCSRPRRTQTVALCAPEALACLRRAGMIAALFPGCSTLARRYARESSIRGKQQTAATCLSRLACNQGLRRQLLGEHFFSGITCISGTAVEVSWAVGFFRAVVFRHLVASVLAEPSFPEKLYSQYCAVLTPKHHGYRSRCSSGGWPARLFDKAKFR